VLKFIHFIERTELVKRRLKRFGIAVRREEIVGKMIQEERERERTIEGGHNSKREENARYVTEIAICSDSQ
jgi:hypothetical protein